MNQRHDVQGLGFRVQEGGVWLLFSPSAPFVYKTDKLPAKQTSQRKKVPDPFMSGCPTILGASKAGVGVEGRSIVSYQFELVNGVLQNRSNTAHG